MSIGYKNSFDAPTLSCITLGRLSLILLIKFGKGEVLVDTYYFTKIEWRVYFLSLFAGTFCVGIADAINFI